MGAAYSNDLREKFLQAYGKGKGTLEELAARFEVSVGWAKKVSARHTRTGEISLPVWRRGPRSRVTAEVVDWLRRQIRDQPDVTLAERKRGFLAVFDWGLECAVGRLGCVHDAG
jgi:transposase